MTAVIVLLIAGGTNMFLDGLYSIILYYGKPSYRGGKPQTWKRDHFIRAIRMGWGLVFICCGGWLINA